MKIFCIFNQHNRKLVVQHALEIFYWNHAKMYYGEAYINLQAIQRPKESNHCRYSSVT